MCPKWSREYLKPNTNPWIVSMCEGLCIDLQSEVWSDTQMTFGSVLNIINAILMADVPKRAAIIATLEYP